MWMQGSGETTKEESLPRVEAYVTTTRCWSGGGSAIGRSETVGDHFGESTDTSKLNQETPAGSAGAAPLSTSNERL